MSVTINTYFILLLALAVLFQFWYINHNKKRINKLNRDFGDYKLTTEKRFNAYLAEVDRVNLELKQQLTKFYDALAKAKAEHPEFKDVLNSILEEIRPK